MTQSDLKVPFFNGYFPKYNDMTQDQLRFYKLWLSEIHKGSFLDIKGNLSYIFVYLYNLYALESYDEILRVLLLLKKHYSEYQKIDEYCNRRIKDFLIAKKQFKDALIYAPNDLNLMLNAGIKVTLIEAVKSNYEYLISTLYRDYVIFLDEIISEIVSIYKKYELENSLDTVSLCFTVHTRYSYDLFSDSPSIIEYEDYDEETDSSVFITPSGTLPVSTEITFYEFDTKKFQNFIPGCLTTAIQIVRKRHGTIKAKEYSNSLEKWLYDRPRRSRLYSEKEVFGREESYQYEISKSQHPIDKHYWLSGIVNWYYSNREYQGFLEKAIDYGFQDIEMFEVCMKQYATNDFKDITSEIRKLLDPSSLPSTKNDFVNSFAVTVKMMTTIYEKKKQYEKVIEVCEKAINIGIKDNTTKGGFERRIELAKKKLI